MCCANLKQNTIKCFDKVDTDIQQNVLHQHLPIRSTTQEDWEDFVMFTIAVILFCTGAVIAVINAYCMGTRCMRVGSNRDIAHFSPCTFY